MTSALDAGPAPDALPSDQAPSPHPREWEGPNCSALPQRLDAITRKDGELERILGQSVAPDGSLLSESLARHLGE